MVNMQKYKKAGNLKPCLLHTILLPLPRNFIVTYFSSNLLPGEQKKNLIFTSYIAYPFIIDQPLLTLLTFSLDKAFLN